MTSSGSITAAPATNRHVYNPGNGVDVAVSDTNGSAGAAGSSIGGGSFTLNNSSGGAAAAFTIELCAPSTGAYQALRRAVRAVIQQPRLRGVFMGVALQDTSFGTGQIQWNPGRPG